MLLAENVKSVEHRYDNAADMLPDELYSNSHSQTPTPVETLKIVSCYEYQSCEHEAWTGSEAEAFCAALTSAAIAALDGYASAPWEWGKSVAAA